ncbi:MAG TPA: hypothetical protein VK186_02230 [Candidatus Deferrimicrobium sp.]|nr:hypothetical protein [Candidatus Deferrimicrobium sp.]
MSNFSVKSKMSPGKIVECSKIVGTNSTSPILLNPYQNSSPITISGSEILRIKVYGIPAGEQVYLVTDSPLEYNLTIQKSITGSDIEWKLFFNTSAKSEATINVTVGQDEPKMKIWRLIAILVAAVFYVLSVLVNEFSKPLWFAGAGFLTAILIGATLHYVIMKKKGMARQYKKEEK